MEEARYLTFTVSELNDFFIERFVLECRDRLSKIENKKIPYRITFKCEPVPYLETFLKIENEPSP